VQERRDDERIARTVGLGDRRTLQRVLVLRDVLAVGVLPVTRVQREDVRNALDRAHTGRPWKSLTSDTCTFVPSPESWLNSANFCS